ncbi:MAG: transglycosylase SLT domain-containing protein [Aeromonadales bacterium]|nr:transglycosylase SLT domain-containing protein [Aeromonadales bacterium]
MNKRLLSFKNTLGVLFLSAMLAGCSTTPPSNTENLCSIFQEKDSWYVAAHKVHKKYGVPINVAMSIMAQESAFREDAQPPMRWFLFVPYGRGSSAYGYAQAQDPVWNDYKKDAGSMFSLRSNFSDSLDFIAWYMTKTKRTNGVALSDAYNQYLNYHEGWGGYRQGTYYKKDWLVNVARKVQQRSQNYKYQLQRCNLY